MAQSFLVNDYLKAQNNRAIQVNMIIESSIL